MERLEVFRSILVQEGMENEVGSVLGEHDVGWSTPSSPTRVAEPRRASTREISLLQGESLQACSPRYLRINLALIRNPFFKSQSSSWLVHPHVHFSVANSAPFAAVLASVSERPYDLCIYKCKMLLEFFRLISKTLSMLLAQLSM
ncbi:hypothetical protein F2Q70_00022046 [Brassica cretica]|uniref:Uncharacterized protein n=1 Tax=Brassica cretica TaxID=69181 RepID=A0A8S9GMI1_BRACR|nr:hypothetical protein F2Q70_00022046 [Brassica cretica]